MKKILFMLFACGALFASCSSDNEAFSEGDGGVDKNPPSEKLYPVSFDLKSDAFTVEQSPLRSLVDANTYLQIVVYKEAGEVYSNTILLGDSINNRVLEDGSLPFTFDLPEGKYHVSFIHTPFRSGNPPTLTNNVALAPNNFYTDEEMGGSRPMNLNIPIRNNANRGSYYQTIDVTVSSVNQNNNIPVVLEPMWANVRFIIEDAKTFEIPSNVNFLRIEILPVFSRYSLASKLATTNVGYGYTITTSGQGTNYGYFNISTYRRSDTYTASTYLSQPPTGENSIKVVLSFASDDMGMGPKVVHEPVIDFETPIENGYNYIIRGKLDDLLKIGSSALNVSLAPFNKEEVYIPFE